MVGDHYQGRLIERASTWSGVATLAEPARADRLAALAALLKEHPAIAGHDPVVLPHVALAFSYRLR